MARAIWGLDKASLGFFNPLLFYNGTSIGPGKICSLLQGFIRSVYFHISYHGGKQNRSLY